ncbi:hypothetical protein CHUAL_005821 [Chamberlinius hualienensis]
MDQTDKKIEYSFEMLTYLFDQCGTVFVTCPQFFRNCLKRQFDALLTLDSCNWGFGGPTWCLIMQLCFSKKLLSIYSVSKNGNVGYQLCNQKCMKIVSEKVSG